MYKFPNKLHDLSTHLIVVESRRGWGFKCSRGSLHKAMDPWAPKWDEALLADLKKVVATKKKVEWYIEWDRIEKDHRYLCRAGVNVGKVVGARSWVKMVPERCYPGWVVHEDCAFEIDCRACDRTGVHCRNFDHYGGV